MSQPVPAAVGQLHGTNCRCRTSTTAYLAQSGHGYKYWGCCHLCGGRYDPVSSQAAFPGPVFSRVSCLHHCFPTFPAIPSPHNTRPRKCPKQQTPPAPEPAGPSLLLMTSPPITLSVGGHMCSNPTTLRTSSHCFHTQTRQPRSTSSSSLTAPLTSERYAAWA